MSDATKGTPDRASSPHPSSVSGWWTGALVTTLTDGLRQAQIVKGQAMAEAGHVSQLRRAGSRILALVDDPAIEPCRIIISVAPWSDAEWESLVDILATQAIHSAQLLNGILSPSVERLLSERRLSLFPGREQMQSQCTCDSEETWCVHALAAIHALGSRLGQDPFALFELRGYSRDDLVLALRDRRRESNALSGLSGQLQHDDTAHHRDLSESLDHFWQMGEQVETMRIHIAEPEVEMELVKVLGEPGFAAGTALRKRLSEMYRVVTDSALRLAYDLDEDDTDS